MVLLTHARVIRTEDAPRIRIEAQDIPWPPLAVIAGPPRLIPWPPSTSENTY